MSPSEERFEHLVAEMLSDAAPSRPPADLVPHAERAVDDARRWPRWLASIKEPPMRHSSTLAVGSPMVRMAAILGATMLIALTLVAAGIAGANLLAANEPIIVDQTGGGTVTTITEAVLMADDGDTILIRPGTYIEAVVIDKHITLLGAGLREEIVIAAPEGGPTRILVPPRRDPYAVLLANTTATMSGLTLRGVTSELHVDGGAPTLEGLLLDGVGEAEGFHRNRSVPPGSIVITGGSSAVVQGNTLLDGGPITAYEGSSPSVIGNTLIGGPSIIAFTPAEGTIVRGNTISATPVRGIGVYGPGRPTIEYNTISGAAGDGISVGGAHNSRGTDPIVRGNTVRDAETGIGVAEQAAPTIEGNTLSHNRTGLAIGYGSDALTVEGNDLVDNSIGIAIGRSNGHFERNSVQGGRAGVVITGESPTLIDNSIEGASVRGLVVVRPASPTLEGNLVCGNVENLVMEPGEDQPVRATNEICDDVSIAAPDSNNQ